MSLRPAWDGLLFSQAENIPKAAEDMPKVQLVQAAGYKLGRTTSGTQ